MKTNILMNQRSDALVTASEIISFVNKSALKLSQKSNQHFVATIGKIDVHPNSAAIIPGFVEMTIDLRATSKNSRQEFLNILEKKRKGFLIVISSVAGDRGRPSNYFYGSAKAALNAYLSGLRSRLYSKNIDVMIVKPGYVKTKMIAAIETPNFLTVSPDFAAKEIYKAHLTKKETIYIKSLWRLIMLIIRNIPSGIFKRLGI